MKLLDKNIKDRTAYLVLELENGEREKFAGKIYSRKSRNINVSGFKKGEAPLGDFIDLYGRD